MSKMAASIVERGEDAFRKLFKYYKRKNPPPDFSEVIDFSKGLSCEKVFSAELCWTAVSERDATAVGLRPVRDWKAFGLHGFPGFVFVSNPFLPGAQRHWVTQSLKVYPQKPNVCNLDMHMSGAETEGIWEKSSDLMRRKSGGQREPKTLLEKLRWVTLGYHYNWDTKTYSPEQYTPFPADLRSMAQQVSAACGFPGFNAEAGILNYYRSDSSLGIHIDESELDHTQPLLSFSFGQSAIFLLGGAKREDPPTAMFMHSGDVMVMSGASRLLYHAVPRVVPPPTGDPLPPSLREQSGASPPEGSLIHAVAPEDWEVCTRYIQSSRVNVTVRQVLGPGQTFPVGLVHRARTESGPSEEYHPVQTDGDKDLLPKKMRNSSSPIDS